jgi:hypothetical protein
MSREAIIHRQPEHSGKREMLEEGRHWSEQDVKEKKKR